MKTQVKRNRILYKIITVSQNSKIDLMKFYKIKDEKMEVIYNFLKENSIKVEVEIQNRDKK